MTSPDLPQQPPANSADGDANHSESANAPQAHSASPSESAAPAPESFNANANASGQPNASASAPEEHARRPEEHAHADEGGPQPGNEKIEASQDDDEGDDGPAPGNEKFPAKAQGQGPAGQPGAPGTGKRKRRRRKKGGAGAAHGTGAPPGDGASAPPAPGEAGAEGAGESATGEAAAGEAPAGEAGHAGQAQAQGQQKKRDKKKKERGPRPERERPAFNVGDVTFGKIIEITEDAIFVDMSGKGKAIFDRREMDLPDEPPPGADDHREHDIDEPEEAGADEAAAASGESGESSGPPDTAKTDTGNTAEEGSESASAVEAEAAGVGDAPAESEAAEALVETAAASAVESTSSESPPSAEAVTEETPAPEASPEASKEETGAVEASSESISATSAQAGEPAAPPQPIWPAIILEVGQQFVGVVHNDGGRGGLIVLTRHPRRAQRAKLVVAGAFKEKGEVLGLVTGVIKGGIEVDVDGLRAFAPGSHMDLRLGADLSPLVGKRLMFQVTQYAKKGRDVVLSRRAFLETEAKAARAEALSKLEVGSVVEGTVRSVVSFGAFIDVGGVEGLVPLSEMSHNRGDGPHDVFKQNEKTPVKILRVDEKGKIWLSRKAAIPDPWSEVAKKYPMGSKHAGKVARLQPFGAFVELEPGIDGLIHTADLSIKRIEHPSEVVKEGDAIDVVVAHLDIGAHKIGLHPAPSGAAADETPQRVQVHKSLKVAVVGHDPGGLIVRILGATGRHARGFITAAATGTPRGTDLRKSFPLNTQLDAKVVELDPRRGEVKLSIKAMQDDTERSAYRQYREQVNRESKFGTFADLLKKKDQPQK